MSNDHLVNDAARLYSCDTFVAMGDVTDGGNVIFGKNSDRPHGEVQEVVAVPRTHHGDGETLQVRSIHRFMSITGLRVH